MFMIYGLIEWRRVGNWRKCKQDCERAKRASRFFNICVENIRFFSNLNIYKIIHCWLITVCRYNMSMTVFVTLMIWSCSLETRNLRKMISSEAERASQNICTFASEKCFTYLPETREKAINDCDLRASHFLCVSETCDSSQYCVGESHSLSVQCVLLFVTLDIYGLIHDDLYRPDTFQKLEKNPLMVMIEQSERAKIFALLRDCVRNVYVFLNRPENQKLMKKLYCERAEICGIFGSETYDSPQYSVDKSHGLSVQ